MRWRRNSSAWEQSQKRKAHQQQNDQAGQQIESIQSGQHRSRQDGRCGLGNQDRAGHDSHALAVGIRPEQRQGQGTAGNGHDAVTGAVHRRSYKRRQRLGQAEQGNTDQYQQCAHPGGPDRMKSPPEREFQYPGRYLGRADDHTDHHHGGRVQAPLPQYLQ